MWLGGGRVLGRWYLWWENVHERGRIARARTPEAIEPLATGAALVRVQASLLLVLVGMIAASFATEALIRGPGLDLLNHLGWVGWFRERLAKPTPETLRNLLAASAAGTATILGLVVSISLLTWQATADRYRSSSIGEFLLRERLGSTVVRMLALAFAYSLWVLALLEVFGHPPYLSTAVALLLSTFAIVSLITFRQIGPLGSVPRQITAALREESVREFRRASRRGAGRWVEERSRKVVFNDLQIIGDLERRLADDGDDTDLAACLVQLTLLTVAYLRRKHELEPDSLFFEQRSERLGPGGESIEDQIVGQGLMTPTQSAPDHLWLERNVIELARRAGVLEDSDQVARTTVALYSAALHEAWQAEETDAFSLLASDLEELGDTPKYRSSPELSQLFMTLPWQLVDAVGGGFAVTDEEIVDEEPWKERRALRRLPWRAREDARVLAEKIETEVVVAGSILTPRCQMLSEVAAVRGPRLADLRERMLALAVSLSVGQLEAALEEGAGGASTIATMTLRTLLRAVHHGMTVPLGEPLIALLVRAIDVAPENQAREVLEDLGRAARIFAERQQWDSAYATLRGYVGGSVLLRQAATDDTTRIRIAFDSIYTATIVFAWGEFHHRDDQLDRAGAFLEPPFADFDNLATLIDNHQLSMLMLPTVKYFRWAQPLGNAAQMLPEQAVEDGGIGFSVERKHPSPLFREIHPIGGPNRLLAYLVRELAERRRAERERLARALRSVLAKRESNRDGD